MDPARGTLLEGEMDRELVAEALDGLVDLVGSVGEGAEAQEYTLTLGSVMLVEN